MPILVLLVSNSQRVFAVVEGAVAAASILPVIGLPYSVALISTTLSLVLKIDVGISEIIKTETLVCFSSFPLG